MCRIEFISEIDFVYIYRLLHARARTRGLPTSGGGLGPYLRWTRAFIHLGVSSKWRKIISLAAPVRGNIDHVRRGAGLIPFVKLLYLCPHHSSAASFYLTLGNNTHQNK